MSQILTHSRLACFRTCPRKHYIRFELGIRPDVDSVPIRVGAAFHAALEARDHGRDPAPLMEACLGDPYDLAMVAAMFDGHCRRYANEPLNPVVSEQEFTRQLVNPGTGRATPIWLLAGKIDRIVRLADGRLALMEYKTTSQDFAPGADYWTRLHMDQQLSIYVLAAREIGYDIQTILYDVTRRPALRPLKATPDEARKYTKDGKLYANQRAEDETPDEYAARVAADIAERPDHYFARIEIARLERDLDDCQEEVWQQQLAIRAAQNSGHWYRNPSACFSPFRCEYLSICQNRDLDTNTPTGFVRSDEIHPELTGDATLAG
ncbi:MAG TPA: PD-(D/E)XK nuclease family protein [Candidatus Krumholzibacteria bacterium]|nr:PD-(D/E)XK nuclease family protein [Candidatus Krumholzibacteria bacterium]HPD73545.1 PD-(D/E)XK nuclease family protein [Candidatus Krumholzibacteria bacterium]HRY42267.1 PD-(D/E)XK nuclease family protein [Candidatus Krumholzibacteria bacterium]